MVNIQHVLTRLKINTASRSQAVQDVRELIESSANPIGAAKAIITNLTAADTVFACTDVIEARMTAQRLVDEALYLGDRYDPSQALRKAAEKIAAYRLSDPWFFFKPSHSTVVTTTETRDGVQVEKKADGRLKKGSKQVLATALYEKHKDKSNAEIIQVFMKELDMTKAGSTTYLYNAKKAAK